MRSVLLQAPRARPKRRAEMGRVLLREPRDLRGRGGYVTAIVGPDTLPASGPGYGLATRVGCQPATGCHHMAVVTMVRLTTIFSACQHLNCTAEPFSRLPRAGSRPRRGVAASHPTALGMLRCRATGRKAHSLRLFLELGP